MELESCNLSDWDSWCYEHQCFHDDQPQENKPIEETTSSLSSFAAEIEQLCYLSQGGKGQLGSQQAGYRKALRGDRPPSDTLEKIGYEVGLRVREALQYLYEVELEIEEVYSAVPDRSLHPPSSNNDSRIEPTELPRPYEASSSTEVFPVGTSST